MQRFDGAPHSQPDHDDAIVWPEPNDLTDWWLRVMTDGERLAGSDGPTRSWR